MSEQLLFDRNICKSEYLVGFLTFICLIACDGWHVGCTRDVSRLVSIWRSAIDDKSANCSSCLASTPYSYMGATIDNLSSKLCGIWFLSSYVLIQKKISSILLTESL
jgi:hypothetical protein